MKVSLNWVKDYVKLPDDMDLKRLSYDLTMSTVEVRRYQSPGRHEGGRGPARGPLPLARRGRAGGN